MGQQMPGARGWGGGIAWDSPLSWKVLWEGGTPLPSEPGVK